METLPKDVQTIDLREPIPGYLLGERLGAGGFGEVWRATAPGGLAKAVKIVYGHMQGDRAVQELKALQKITSLEESVGEVGFRERAEIVIERGLVGFLGTKSVGFSGDQ
ncbi:MAG: hypothetical protein QGG09_10540, partial [Pirellulaceae bacterium]|nr:hypothetical protein [Pirellulaceae bacterium]